MFKKAFSYDEKVVFYFDGHDHKYVAKNGSLAWRLNNPGLVSSHSSIAKQFKAIGSHQQYAIFSDLLIGNDAHRAWLVSSKYCDAPLTELCKHYQPSDPAGFLKKLCAITLLEPTTKPRTLTGKDFEDLLRAVQQLLGFVKENAGEFHLLPKITLRFCSRDRKIEYYLVGHEHLITQKEAFGWVAAHRLDAVIVNKKNGTIYLRSRPGHHFNQIHFNDGAYGQEREFKDAIRDVGEMQSRQCIWGYVNGISTSPKRAKECADLIAKYARGQQVWSLINDTSKWTLGNLADAFFQKLNWETDIVKNCTQFLKFLLDLSNRNISHPPVVIFSHSQGALIMDLALERLRPDEQRRIHVFTFGAARFLSPEKAHPASHNYLSAMDPIPIFASKDTYRFLLQLYEGKKRGLTSEDIVKRCIGIDLISNEQAFSSKERRLYYENELAKTQNITILDHTESDSWEHSFDLPCYQTKIQEIVEQYYKNGGKAGS